MHRTIFRGGSLKNKTITILGKPYKLLELSEVESLGNMGTTRRAKQIIHVDKELAKDQYSETILHEIIHVIDEELNLGLDEQTIARLAVGIYSAHADLKGIF